MRDRPIILAGLAVFLAIAGFPFWYNAATLRTTAGPALQLPPGKQCVAPVEYMKGYHMRMLDSWRDQAVRNGVRHYTSPGGKTFDISLTGTCLARCHQDRAAFCDRCHAYVGVRAAYCWDCHNSPVNALRSAR